MVRLMSVFALSFMLSNCTTPASIEPVDVSDEIRESNKKFMEAFKNGDAAAVAARYTTDGRLLPPNSEMIQGHDAITAYWQAGMDAGLTEARFTTVSATAYGDIAYEVGLADVFVGEGQLVDKSKFIVIWKKVDGQWKMHEDIWNSSLPAPPPPPAEEATDSE